MVVASDVFDESGEFDIPSVDNHGVLFALVCVFVYRVQVVVSIEHAILCVWYEFISRKSIFLRNIYMMQSLPKRCRWLIFGFVLYRASFGVIPCVQCFCGMR